MSLLDESLTAAPSGQLSSEASAPGGQDLEDTTLDEPVLETIKRDLRMVWRKIGKVAIPSQDTKDELRNWDLWGPLFLCLILAILLSIDESEGGLPSNHDRPAAVFSSLLVMVAVGAIVVTVNAKLLGGNVSFFQNICLLGYCVAPMILATILCIIVRITMTDQAFTCGLGEFNKKGGKVTTTCGPPAWPEGVCRNSANETANIGAACTGWNDESCTGDARCNDPHTVVTNVVLRLLFAIGGMVWSLRSSLGFLSEVVKPERRGLAAYPACLFFASIAWMIMLRTSSA
uniref:Protein YIPF n=1 Tax=Hemiselmis tepida TaxID=464990 RepID=A0A7S0VU54_9CRYP|mmetsp:Transcript_28277/g.71638  ORF Transcript_28277/g.71638 Transcript_28277/m.71638 type:complete len:288 (+) Transcript_28277:31-894(+)|eukprot:CAMPEP_0174927642 /NCGR_PEP_ID=MMETSP1355-20121228/19469_1 /TAXON_ID=464990 /ORGANISM="Hemiselmis tepida, Strain CCMP443" /LENGTH=287 /DNA_ID=CAMNT_0016173759 /DNA_START=27 /DNA_END=890 /DNA_ORIENTATION=+